jgi:hypothetical protein
MKDVIYMCDPDGEPVVPGVKRLRDYCKCGRYTGCPDYQACVRAGGYLGLGLAS